MKTKLFIIFIIAILITSGSDNNIKNTNLVLIPSGEFEMGDHHNLGGQEHGNDEIPVHKVLINSFYISKTEVTNLEYVEFLNDSFSKNFIEIKNGKVYQKSTDIIYCDTDKSDPASRIIWDGKKLSIMPDKENHPVICVRWNGATAYCNWLSIKHVYEKCYGEIKWEIDFTKKGYRLPTEAEWEYSALGGKYSPYYIYWFGDKLDYTKANLPKSGDPFETGALPYTSPVGFYNGKTHLKAEYNWPGTELSFKTTDGANGYGLYDIAGNVWEWCNDWYSRDYYYFSLDKNPGGPIEASPMPDGKPYHVLRGGSWYNGFDGHSRVSNRNPGYFRGPQDPDHSYYQIGFRIALDLNGNKKESIDEVKYKQYKNTKSKNEEYRRK